MGITKGQKFQSTTTFNIIPTGYDFDKVKDLPYYSYNYVTLKGNTSLEVINFDETSVELSIKSDQDASLGIREYNAQKEHVGPAGTYKMANTQFSYICDRQYFEKLITNGILKELLVTATYKKNYTPLIIGCSIGIAALITIIVVVKNKS